MSEVQRLDGVKIMQGDRNIEGVNVIRLRRIPDGRETIVHMLKCTDPHFIHFGEIYFSTVYPGVVNGWHKHREMRLNYAGVFGQVKVVLSDDREESPTEGTLMEIFTWRDNYNWTVVHR